MSDRGFGLAEASLLLALVIATSGWATAEGDQLLATIDKPAVVTLEPAGGSRNGAADASGRVVLKIAGFRPAQDGSAVQAIVKVQRADGSEQEVHRFTVFPQAEFKADGSSKPRMFGFSLPRELASGEPVTLKVELAPLRGKGTGASLEVGGVDRESAR